MTNLPITTSTPQPAATGKQGANSAGAADGGDTQSTKPFGEVLARQITPPETKSAKSLGKLALDLAAQFAPEAADLKKDNKALPDTAAALPTDMLAILIPQTAAATVIATPAATTTDANTASADSRIDIKQDSAAVIPADISGRAVQKQTGGIEKTAPDIAAAPQAKGTTPFAAALGEITRDVVSGKEVNSRDAAAIVAASQQPTAAAMSTIQNAAASVAAPAIQAAQLKVDTPVGQQRWGDEFGQKITWLASSKTDQTAELHLNPPQLGPVDVVIKVSGDHATATFTSAHAAVREAVEQAIPKLRDMMADNGITLGNTTVSDQTPRDQGKPEAQRNAMNSGSDNDLHDTVATGSGARVSQITRHNGIVDTFA